MLRDRTWTGTFHRVRVIPIQRGPKKTEVLLFYGRVDQISWDPLKFEWDDGAMNVPFMNYSTKLGRKMLMGNHQVPNPVVRKWGGTLPDDFRLRWKTVWHKDRTWKEARLIWLIWHYVVAVNHWRGRIDGTMDIRCPVCPRRSEESMLHRFWECLSAQRVWQWAIHIMNALLIGRDAQGPWRLLTWRQGIFSGGIPRKFNALKWLWLEVRTVVLWVLWIQRNDMVFNNQAWTDERLLQYIWSGLLDYGCVEWAKVCNKHPRTLLAQRKLVALRKLVGRRCRKDFFTVMVAGQPRWVATGPSAGFVFQPP